jgi:hypothetical protein
VEELTPARALVAELIRRYEVLGIECSVLEVQKLAWFLNRAVGRHLAANPLNLDFVAGKYGPYTDRLRHLIDALDGSYLHSERRLADARPADPVWFEDSKRDVIARFLAEPDKRQFTPLLDEVTAVIEGFESPLGLEALSTVDWLIHVGRVEPSMLAIRAGLANWPAGAAAAQRKQRIIDDRLLQLALDRVLDILGDTNRQLEATRGRWGLGSSESE